MFVLGDSGLLEYEPVFDLVLTSPPFFHPKRVDARHGFSPGCRDLEGYATYVASILAAAAGGLKRGCPLCVVKTDVWYRGRLIPIGFRIADQCARLGLALCAHWIWEKSRHFSPYGPSFANIFIFGRGYRRPRHTGIVSSPMPERHSGYRTSFTPDLFKQLLLLLSRPDDIVLDPFAGAGGVIEAAAATGRWSVAVEICEQQMALAKARLGSVSACRFQGLTGPRLVSTDPA